MKIKYKLPDKILKFINNCDLEEITIGCSCSQVIKITNKDKVYFLKMAKKGILTSEYKKLKWLDGKLEVPKIVLYDVFDDNEYLITDGVAGEMVCSDYYISNKEIGIKAIADAFKKIYSVDIKDCPFNVSMDYKLSIVENNVNNNLISEHDLDEEILKRYGNIKNILLFLKNNKFNEELCFSYGDVSLPNIFAKEDKCVGFVDVGECGIADKWFDLAICEKSIKRNYGVQYVSKFYEELNIVPDRNKIDYYLLLMELYL